MNSPDTHVTCSSVACTRAAVTLTLASRGIDLNSSFFKINSEKLVFSYFPARGCRANQHRLVKKEENGFTCSRRLFVTLFGCFCKLAVARNCSHGSIFNQNGAFWHERNGQKTAHVSLATVKKGLSLLLRDQPINMCTDRSNGFNLQSQGISTFLFWQMMRNLAHCFLLQAITNSQTIGVYQ